MPLTHPCSFPPSSSGIATAAKKSWDNILLQFSLVEEHCRNQTSGLMKHGYESSKKAVWADPETGASPLTWVRALGWYFMALVDILDWLPVEHEGYGKLMGWARQLEKALRETQDGETGGWWLVMDGEFGGEKGKEKGNYVESSGIAMYVYGLLKGVRMGYLEDGYRDVAMKACDGLVERFVKVVNGTGDGQEVLNWEGTVRVGSLDGKGDFEVSYFDLSLR